MQAYAIDYTVNGKFYSRIVDAKDLKSAKNKLGRRHGYKTGRMVKIIRVNVVGYY